MKSIPDNALKYVDTQVTFAEIPDEISLCINISNCPIGCDGCHSSYLWGDIGTLLTPESLSFLIERNTGITCVCFMGGDIGPDEINRLAGYVRHVYCHLKIGWYSGRQELSRCIDPKCFDYIKLGPYIPEKGGLNSPSTNQRFYKIENGSMIDKTFLFWR